MAATIGTKEKLFCLFVVFLVVFHARAQSVIEPIPSNLDVISVDTSLVTLNVSVMDRKHRHVPGLRAEDFQLTDEGKPVRPAFFDSQGPESIVFLVDVSSSMKGEKWQNLTAGMKRFLAKGQAGSDYSMIAFNEEPRLIIEHANAEQLWQSFKSLRPDGETALYDALLAGLEVLDRASQRHKALVLLSDGEDMCSHAGLPLVEQQVLVHRATIYPVGIIFDQRLSPYQPDGKKLLNELAEATGGFVVFPEPHAIPDTLELIRNDISNQYSLSYYPPDKIPGWRRVQVTVATNAKRVRVRYQERYQVTNPQMANR